MNTSKMWCMFTIVNLGLLSIFAGVTTADEHGGMPDETLQSRIEERITILDNGESEVDITITISSPELAAMYREGLGVPDWVGLEDEIIIPEYTIASDSYELGEGVEIAADNSVMGTKIPVKSIFYQSLSEEQELLYGLYITEFTNATMVPHGVNGECRVHVTAHAIPTIYCPPAEDETQYPWLIAFEPITNETKGRAAGFTISQFSFTKQLLESTPEKHQYITDRTTTIVLPENVAILNSKQVNKQQKTIIFDDQSQVITATHVDSDSQITLTNKEIITQGTLIDMENISAYYLSHESSLIQCMAHQPATYGIPINITDTPPLGGGLIYWEWSWYWRAWNLDLIDLQFKKDIDFGLLSASVDIGLVVRSVGEIGFTLAGYVLPPQIYCKEFHAWIDNQASAWAEASIGITPGVGVDESFNIYTYKKSYTVWIGPVPVVILMQVDLDISFYVSVEGKLEVSAGARFINTFKLGVQWIKDEGWKKIDERIHDKGYHWDLEIGAKVTVRVGPEITVKALLYAAAGPEVKLGVYLEAILTIPINLSINNITIDINLELNLNITGEVGIGFADALEKLLGIDGFTFPVFGFSIPLWKGHWNYTVPLADDVPPSTTRSFNGEKGRINYGGKTFVKIGTGTKITLRAEDNQAGINETEYQYTNINTNVSSGLKNYSATGPFRIEAPGYYKLSYRSKDNNSNWENTTTDTYLYVQVTTLDSFFMLENGSYYEDTANNRWYVNDDTDLRLYSYWDYTTYGILHGYEICYNLDGINGTYSDYWKAPTPPQHPNATLPMPRLYPLTNVSSIIPVGYGSDCVFQKVFDSLGTEGPHNISWFGAGFNRLVYPNSGNQLLYYERNETHPLIYHNHTFIVDTTPPDAYQINPPQQYYPINSSAGYLKLGESIHLTAQDICTSNQSWASGLIYANGLFWGYKFWDGWHPQNSTDNYTVTYINNTNISTYNHTAYFFPINDTDNRSWYVYNDFLGISFYEERPYTLEYYVKDNVHNYNLYQHTYFIDGTAPTTTIMFGTPYFTNHITDWITSNTDITLSSVDGGLYPCGVTSTYYCVDNNPWNNYTAPFNINGEGRHILSLYSVDNVGNIEPIVNSTPHVDNIPPFSTLVIKGDMNNNWYTDDVIVGILAYDNDSGVAKTMYRRDGREWTEYEDGLLIWKEGQHIIEYYSVDNLGNVEASKFFEFNLDKSSPSVNLTYPNGGEIVNGTMTIEWTATDLSTVRIAISYSDDGGMTWHSVAAATDNDGEYVWDTTTVLDSTNFLIKIVAKDEAGHIGIDTSDSKFTVYNTPLQASISFPRSGHLYINDREIIPLPLGVTVIIGKITLKAEATCGIPVDRMEFSIDYAVVGSDTIPPYEFLWDSRTIGPHTIEIRAIDAIGTTTTDVIRVLTLNFLWLI